MNEFWLENNAFRSERVLLRKYSLKMWREARRVQWQRTRTDILPTALFEVDWKLSQRETIAKNN